MTAMHCTSCGQAVSAGDAFCGKCGTAVTSRRAQDRPAVVIQGVVRSQVAVGNGNVQVLVNVDGASRYTERSGGVELQAREIPALATTSRPSLVGRDALIEEAHQALSAGMNVQLFGTPGVGRSGVAEAILRRMAETGTRCVEMRPDNEPHTLESVYRRLMEVFFGVVWYQPEESVLRLEVNRFELSALIMITDCDLPADDLNRLLGTFPGCAFLLTSHRRTLADDAGTALEVDPLTPSQARELITRALGGPPAGLQNLQWEEAYRLAGGQVQRLIEHIAFIRRSASRPGQTDLLNVPISEQVALLVAGLSEAARRVLVALATYQLALAPGSFPAVTGLPDAAGAAAELTVASLISADGPAFRIVSDAAAAVADTGQRSDPAVAADGLLQLLGGPELPDPHLVLSVARALRQAGDDLGTVKLTRAGAPAALAMGAISVWISLVALGVQVSTSSRRTQDLEFFLNEEHTGALLRGDMVAAAAALAAIAELIAEQQPAASIATQRYPAGPHGTSGQDTRLGQQARRAIRQTKHGRLAGHPAIVIVAAVGVAAIAAGATAAVISSGSHPSQSVAGAWSSGPGATFTFAPTDSGSYQISLVFTSGTRKCSIANDGSVTGANGHFQGILDLHQDTDVSAGQCPPNEGTAKLTIDIAASGTSASVNYTRLTGDNCTDCGQQTWTRQS
jgi:hypothetical protein